MKAIGRAVEGDVWAASLDRPSHQIYAKDRQEQRDRAKSWTPDSLQVNAERIKRGDAVGEEYLWGRRAVQMIKLGMLLEDTLESHRKAYLEAYRELYSKNLYDMKLADLTQRHKAAKEQYALT